MRATCKEGAVSALNLWVNQKGITEDLLVIAGDNYFEFDLSHFIAVYNGENTLVAICDIGDKNKASHFGVVMRRFLRLSGERLF